MTGRPLGRKNFRSFMASNELERLGVNPIEKALEGIKQLDELIKTNIEAYASGRGYSDRSDAGPAYLANAVRAVMDKNATYMALAKFKYPTLSAVAIKDMTDHEDRVKSMTTLDAIKVIQADPFAPNKIKEKSAKEVASWLDNETPDDKILPTGNKEK